MRSLLDPNRQQVKNEGLLSGGRSHTDVRIVSAHTRFFPSYEQIHTTIRITFFFKLVMHRATMISPTLSLYCKTVRCPPVGFLALLQQMEKLSMSPAFRTSTICHGLASILVWAPKNTCVRNKITENKKEKKV